MNPSSFFVYPVADNRNRVNQLLTTALDALAELYRISLTDGTEAHGWEMVVKRGGMSDAVTHGDPLAQREPFFIRPSVGVKCVLVDPENREGSRGFGGYKNL